MGRSKVEYYVNKLCTIWSLLLTNSIQSTTETHSSQTIQKEISFFYFKLQKGIYHPKHIELSSFCGCC
jgi:hypothetical protein